MKLVNALQAWNRQKIASVMVIGCRAKAIVCVGGASGDWKNLEVAKSEDGMEALEL